MKDYEYAWLSARHHVLPKWAQNEISNLRGAEANRDMADCLNADIRHSAKQVLGDNFTFADDDLRILVILAVRAIDAGMTDDIPASLLPHIERAKLARNAEREVMTTHA